MSGISPLPSYSTAGVRSCPGRFDGLNGFLRVLGAFNGKPHYSKYETVQFVNPEPGAIIHIVDDETTPQGQDSSVHQRVMLVVRHENPMSRTLGAMTCIPLCRYNGELPMAEDRCWNIQQGHSLTSIYSHHDHAQNPGIATPVNQKSLTVILKRNTHLEEGIQANLEELWRIGYGEILVDKIGRASSESLALALSRIGELFARPPDVLPEVRRYETEVVSSPDVRKYQTEMVSSPDARKYETEVRKPHKSSKKKGVYTIGNSRKGYCVRIK